MYSLYSLPARSLCFSATNQSFFSNHQIRKILVSDDSEYVALKLDPWGELVFERGALVEAQERMKEVYGF